MSLQRSNRQSINKQKGMVIVVALFIVALVATMAYVMIARLDRDTRRTTLILRNSEAENVAEGSIAWAMDTLKNNLLKKSADRIVDKMPITSPVMKANGFDVVSTIYDMQARYNLNNLTQATKADFSRLLQTVSPKLPKTQVNVITDAVINWISAGSQTDALAKYYQSLGVPYRPRHAPMFNASELNLVKGITPQIYLALLPYITALPLGTLVNAQTVSPEVMVTLGNTMTLAAGKSAETARKHTPILTPAAFLSLDVIKNHRDIKPEKLTVVSNYFLVETKVTIEKQRTLIYTLLKRAMSKDNKPEITIVWQSKGSW